MSYANVSYDDIVQCIRVVSFFNMPMNALVKLFEDQQSTVSSIKPLIEDRVSTGWTYFDALARENPTLADAVHDYVYKITHPHNDIMVKNLAREEVTKSVLAV